MKYTMNVYYVVIDFGHGHLEMMSGPYGSRYEAEQGRHSLCNGVNDHKLIIVGKIETVEDLK